MRTEETQPYSAGPLRIGIWCDYGFTLTPSAGIGVFVYNLAAGLLELDDENLEIVMLVRPGDQNLIQDLHDKSGGRLTCVPRSGPPPHESARGSVGRNPVKPLFARWLQFTDFCRSWKRGVKSKLLAGADTFRQETAICVRKLRDRLRSGNRLAAAVVGVGILLGVSVLTVVWLLYGFYRFLVACVRALTFPQRILDRIARSTITVPEPLSSPQPGSSPQHHHDPLALVRAAGCDVWLIPYYGIDRPLDFPAVLVIHDLVHLRFPESLPEHVVAALSTNVPQRASEATLCACMSAFIRDNDLLGALSLPRQKVRMVRVAAPSDFPEITDNELQSLKPTTLTRPYLFFPAEFRRYKNQQLLVEALHVLRGRGEDSFDVVFTGGSSEVPDEIASLINRYNLQTRVHILGRVTRSMLAALYRDAFATIVPSLYEQGSFPVYEALRWNCPVACSHIPPLVEQCAAMGDAMLYFDPHDAPSLADVIQELARDREGAKMRQAEASKSLWDRSWKDAAADWLKVFREAAQISGVPWSHGTPATVKEPLEAFLFMPVAYQGGIAEAANTTIANLADVNRERGRLRLTIGIPKTTSETKGLCSLPEDVIVEPIVIGDASRQDLEEVYGPNSLEQDQKGRFAFFELGASAAKRADSWLALADRFTQPLLPMRPYAVIVYDVIQRRFPEAFEDQFLKYWQEGILPTLRGANIVVMNPEAGRDLTEGFGILPRNIRLLPYTWDLEKRFGSFPHYQHPAASCTCLLNVTNASVHKGADLLLRAYSRLKLKSEQAVPPLVLCGTNTDAFSKTFGRPLDHPYWAEIRYLVPRLGLIEGQDVHFLGFVTDNQLKTLYQQCAAVVNTAKYDMGSYSLVEASYFGRPAISTRYPGVEYLARRFNIPICFVPMDDEMALAEALRQALARQPMKSEELVDIQRSLITPQFHPRRFAEGLYDVLLAMGERGRWERNWRTSRRY